MAVLVTAIHADPLPLGLKTICVGAACERMQSLRLGTAGTSPAMTAGRPATSRGIGRYPRGCRCRRRAASPWLSLARGAWLRRREARRAPARSCNSRPAGAHRQVRHRHEIVCAPHLERQQRTSVSYPSNGHSPPTSIELAGSLPAVDNFQERTSACRGWTFQTGRSGFGQLLSFGRGRRKVHLGRVRSSVGRRSGVDIGHSAEGSSRNIVTYAKVLLDRADAL
jgi:hypothetical protein